MKSFDEQNKVLTEFDKTFNHEDFQSCVDRGMLLIRNREAQMVEDGYEWNIETNTCRWAIEQAVTNRKHGSTMMSAVIGYVESIELRVARFNDSE